MHSTTALVKVESGLAVTSAAAASGEKVPDAGDHLQRFIELSEDCGIDGIAEFLAQACEVEAGWAEDNEDEALEKRWRALAPALRKIAQRATALYAEARAVTVLDATFEEETIDARK